MQVLLGFSVLAVMAGAGWVMYTGVATVQRRIARWLLADCYDDNDAEKKLNGEGK